MLGTVPGTQEVLDKSNLQLLPIRHRHTETHNIASKAVEKPDHSKQTYTKLTGHSSFSLVAAGTLEILQNHRAKLS